MALFSTFVISNIDSSLLFSYRFPTQVTLYKVEMWPLFGLNWSMWTETLGDWQLRREMIEHKVYSEWIRCVLRGLQII